VTPEWGFPKGRRDQGESEFACAIREFWEETNIRDTEIYLLRNVEPLVESFVGSNRVQYAHKYYLAFAPQGVGTKSFAEVAAANEHVRREVGDIRWISLSEAETVFRPEHAEKREILRRIRRVLEAGIPFAPGLELS
jgi:8-oxo-dGTP pyrophosphatase MutT (NUDIX family)